MLSHTFEALLGACVLAIVLLMVKVRRLGGQLADFRRREPKIRSDAVKRSRIGHMASIFEQLAPLLPGFRYNPKDVQWVGGGGGIDAIVWNGLEAGGDVEIVFLDVKAGNHARLTSNQRRIREAIVWKRIAFDEYRPPDPTPLLEALPPDPVHDESVPLADGHVAEADYQGDDTEVIAPDAFPWHAPVR